MSAGEEGGRGGVVRGGDDDLGVDELLVEFRVLAFFVGGGYEGVALRLEPFAEAELVLGCAEEAGNLFGVDATL
jgi:hypothetical protein